MEVKNITFTSRNVEVRNAEKILRKLKQDFPTVSPYMADYLGRKQNSEITGRWAHLSHAKANLLRKTNQKKVLDDDLMYARVLIESIKKYGAARCKESVEMAYVLARTNGYKNVYCANIYQILPESVTPNEIDHTILLVNIEKPKGTQLIDKFYIEKPYEENLVKPKKTTIAIDPLTDFVGYWDDLILKYKNENTHYNTRGKEAQKLFPELVDTSKCEFKVQLKKPFLEDDSTVKKLKAIYPALYKKGKTLRCKLDFSETDEMLNQIKILYPEFFVKDDKKTNPGFIFVQKLLNIFKFS